MNRLLLVFTLIFITSITLIAQKRAMNHDDFDQWNRIRDNRISDDGEYIIYRLTPGNGDATLNITKNDGRQLASFERVSQSAFTADSRFVVFTITPGIDTLNQLRRLKTKPKDLPKDSLGIYDIETKTTTKIGHVKGFKIPEKWSGYVAYQLEDIKVKKDTSKTDTAKVKKKPRKKVKKVSKDNGFHLILRNLSTRTNDTLKYVLDYTFAEEGKSMLYTTTGSDSTVLPGVYYLDLAKGKETPLTRSKGKYKQLSLSKDGLQAAFISDLDTTKSLIRNAQLRYWKPGMDSALVKADAKATFTPENWIVNEHSRLSFSDDGKRLFFGTAPQPILKDTTLLPEEVVKVEIWGYKDSRLHTQQNIELEADQKKAYQAMMNTETFAAKQLANVEMPEISIPDNKLGSFAVGISDLPYQQYISWEGWPKHNDYYSLNLSTGERKVIVKDVRGNGAISTTGKYAYWYNAEDSSWNTYNNTTGVIREISEFIPTSMADELNDAPNLPREYGMAGWTEDDQYVLIYDRYDIWRVDPSGKQKPLNLTNGRAKKMRFRYIDLDRENEAIDLDNLLLSVFSEITRKEGFYEKKKNKALKELIFDDFKFSNPRKARLAKQLIFTKESQTLFPDVLVSDQSFKKITKLSEANPNQKDYLWGSVELYNWTSLDGEQLEGLLYKPENFDPAKKYPMITYFYERNSDNLNRHWGIVPIRSIVNPTFYASNGYLVFIPDITYKTGYAGESCYNDVIPGVTKLISEGFVDEDKIGVQGHSWGGYQTAYLVTKTDIFAAAEAGAPVANMISAYGGIRWWTGLSRMFQYEHTQSRIGGTLWEYPLRYMENSPIFYLDKVNTPLLIMHNDADGHVPWYQGIELYVSLRRLGKPAWMLNYNGEPHWPTKWENIRDFNIRMNQYFDHYLKDKPMPEWMDKGIPAVQKGINKGYRLMEE